MIDMETTQELLIRERVEALKLEYDFDPDVLDAQEITEVMGFFRQKAEQELGYAD